MNFDKQRNLLIKEYEAKNLLPEEIVIDGKKLMIPLEYKGNVSKFVNDIFQVGREKKRWEKNLLTPVYANVKIGGVSKKIPVSYNVYKICQKLNLSKDVLKNVLAKKTVSKAFRRYKAAIKKVEKCSKYYPNKKFKFSMDDEYITEIEKAIRKHQLKMLGQKMASTFKWTTAQTFNVLAGAVGAVPAVAYYGLKKISVKKGYKFPHNKITKLIENDITPYICKGAMKMLIPAAIFVTGKAAVSMPGHGNVFEKINIFKGKDASSISANYAEKSFHITDEASFKELYDAAFPLLIQTMLPTEIYVDHAYTDNNRTVNTIGIGSYWYPRSGNPQSSRWMLTKDYAKQHPNMKVSGTEACNLADGWFCYREGGRVYNKLYEKLKGCELKVCEFVAIAGCTYNSESSGFAFCNYVKKHYNDPVKCAAFLANLKPKNSSCNDGIKKRHAHEALIYLNLNGYAENVPLLMVKEGVNSRGRRYYVSSVTQLTPSECNPMIKGLKNGNTVEAKKLADKICGWRAKGAETVAEIMNKTGMEIASTLNMEQYEKTFKLNNIYKNALSLYEQKDYAKAVEGFKDFIKNGGTGAEIHNDLAISYFHLGKYDECLKETKIVLKTDEKEQYAPAYYNAAKAYEAMGDTEKAKQYFEKAKQARKDSVADLGDVKDNKAKIFDMSMRSAQAARG